MTRYRMYSMGGEMLVHKEGEFYLVSDTEEKIDKLEKQNKELIENIQYFIDRVEAGTIRSKTTYAIYKNLLAKIKGGQ